MATADSLPALAPGFRFWFRTGLFGRGGKTVPRVPVQRQARLLAEAVPFQDDLEELINEPPPPLLGGGHYLAAVMFVLLFVVAAVAQVDIVVTGSGRLTTDGPPIVLQPMERSVILELLVKPGDTVIAGQVVAVLDATIHNADHANLAAQQRTLAAQWQRLEAELAGSSFDVPPDAPPERVLQGVLHAQRQTLLATRLRGLSEDMEGLEAAMRSQDDSGGFLSEQAVIARDVESMRSRLLAGQIGSRLQYLGARSQRLQAEQELSTSRNRIRELQHALRSKEAERQTFLNDWRRQLLEEAIRVRTEHVRVVEELAKIVRMSELMMLTAPQDGVVLDVARRSVGSVIREAEPLVTLVPSHLPLIAEIAVQSADIGYSVPGDAVVLKVDAFPYQRHGLLHGRLRGFSQESFGAGGGRPDGDFGSAGQSGAVHRGHVVLDQTALANMPAGARLSPGMTVNAEIKVGRRSVISYFLYPLIRGFQESVREP